MPARLPRALFVCVHNAGRSQMAQAFWERLGGEGRSAGSDPGERVHPKVVEVMRELGVDVAGRIPHRLAQSDAEWAEVVVTMGCGDACPYVPGRRYVEWNLDDPAARDVDAVRAIREEIRRRVDDLAGDSARQGGSHSMDIEHAINVGPVLARELRGAGIATTERLRELGALEAWRLVGSVFPDRHCSSALLALEGAVRGVRWTTLPAEERGRICRLAAENGATR